MRVKIFYLLIGVFALIFSPLQSFADGVCGTDNRCTAVRYGLPSYGGTSASNNVYLYSFNSCGVRTQTGSTSGDWCYQTAYIVKSPSTPGGVITTTTILTPTVCSAANQNYAAAPYNSQTGYTPTCTPCDTADTDQDGVCNQCDTAPGSPDPHDCVHTTINDSSGVVYGYTINKGCKANPTDSDLERYENHDYTPEGKSYYGVSTGKGDIGSKNCNASSVSSSTCCSYSANNGTGPSILPTWASSASTSGTGSTTSGNTTPSDEQKEAEQLGSPTNPNQPDNCSDKYAKCEAYCADKGGTTSNLCTNDSTTGYTNSACSCSSSTSNAYGTSSPTSNNYAQGSAQASNSTFDGIDSKNLHDIEENTASTAAGIKGVGKSVDGLGGKLDSLGSKLDAIAGKLDGQGEDDGDGDVTISGTGTIPEGGTYEKDIAESDQVKEKSLPGAISDLINSVIPVSSAIRSSGVHIASANPVLSFSFHGNDVVVDFSKYENVLDAAGIVLVFCATIAAFLIIL